MNLSLDGNYLRILLLFFMTLTTYELPSSDIEQVSVREISYRQISMEEYINKVTGGWLGQAIGVLFGQYTEFRWIGQIVPFDLEDWCRPNSELSAWWKKKELWGSKEYWEKSHDMLNNKKYWEIWTPDTMPDQDDLYIEFMFLHSIMKYGLDVTGTEMAMDWINYLDPNRVYGSNHQAYQNFQKGIFPPLSGHPSNSIWAEAIDFQIEADLFGLISPGLPGLSNEWCDKTGHMMSYGDGVYAGMAIATMYSEAFFESDPHKLAEYSLKVIPAESGYAEMIRDVLAFHQLYPDWQDAWNKLEEKWGTKKGEIVKVHINGAYVYMGLLYGDGDFWKTMNISMRCGYDSDCNPSSSAGILGTILGMKGIPEKWAILRDLPIENQSIKKIYQEIIDWDEIIHATVETGKWNILENGGYLENGVFNIPLQKVNLLPLEQTTREE